MPNEALARVNAADQYGGVARFLHWAVAAMIVLQFVLAKLGEWAEHDGERLRQLALLANHKSVGMTVLALALLRIGWRVLNPPPKLPAQMPGWQKTASHVSHWSLYVLLFALPISGWLMSSASNYSVSWFGLFTWPDLVEPSKALRATLHEVHEILGKALLVIALVHIAAAFKHQWVDKDGVLARISSWPVLIVFGVLLAAGVFTLTDTAGDRANAGAPALPAADTDAVPADDTTAADESANIEETPVVKDSAATDLAAMAVEQPPTAAAETAPTSETATPTPKPKPAKPPSAAVWQVDYAQSYIRFTAEQAGANFTGEWQQWSSDMRFSDDALADSAFEVRIEVSGVDTSDDERDNTLMDAEWFAADDYPVVIFRTAEMTKTADGYRAEASLALKGERKPVVFDFNVEKDGERRRLTGKARLDRIALGIGTGEWTDTEWVGQYVDVDVLVIATLR